jgi:hypothetical protein
MQPTLLDLHCHIDTSYSKELILLRLREVIDQTRAIQVKGLILGVALRGRSGGDLDICKAKAEVVQLFQQLPDFDSDFILSFAFEVPVTIIFGYQLYSSERLELLAYGKHLKGEGNKEEYIPGKSAFIDLIKFDFPLKLIPWSPGKWLGERGEIIRDSILENSDSSLHLIDSRLRAWPFKRPILFDEIEERGRAILCGSDPLPLDNEEMSLLSYCNLVKRNIEIDKFTIFERLNSLKKEDLAIFGKRLSTIKLISSLYSLYTGASHPITNRRAK